VSVAISATLGATYELVATLFALGLAEERDEPHEGEGAMGERGSAGAQSRPLF